MRRVRLSRSESHDDPQVERARAVLGVGVAGGVADRLASGAEQHLGGQRREVGRRALTIGIDLPGHAVKLAAQIVHHAPECPDQPESSDVRRQGRRQRRQEGRDLVMGVGEQPGDVRCTVGCIVWSTIRCTRLLAGQPEQRRVQQGQHVVVERPPHSTVQKLILGEAASLEHEQAAGKLTRRPRVDQALAGRSRYLDLLLAVQAAVWPVPEQ